MPKPRTSARSSKKVAQAAIAHRGQPGLGEEAEVKLTLRVTLSRTQAERLTVRAISEGKNLNALVGEILETAPTEPTA